MIYRKVHKSYLLILHVFFHLGYVHTPLAENLTEFFFYTGPFISLCSLGTLNGLDLLQVDFS